MFEFECTITDEPRPASFEKIPLETAVELVLGNEIRDGKTQAAVLKTAEFIRRGEL